MSEADSIVDLYERHADVWDRRRLPDLIIEREWIGRFLALLPTDSTILDLGCGSGQPIARYLIDGGLNIVGIDSSPTLIEKCRTRFPEHEWLVADMRSLSLGRQFDGLIVWDSFFHLSPEHQRAMFPVFSKHAGVAAPLLLTSGSRHGEEIGSFEGEPLYHASLSTEEYRQLFDFHGFKVIAHVVDDPNCGYHTVWLAQAK